MVLQLVLPSSSDDSYEFNNYLTTSSATNDTLSTNLPNLRDKSQRNSQQDINSRINHAFVNPAFINDNNFPEFTTTNPSFRLYTREQASNDDSIYEKVADSTSIPEKNRVFKKHLTKILSCIYAVFIVTLGLVIYISDIIIGNTALAETFSIYLLIVDFVYILYLVIDIRLYLNQQKMNARNSCNEIEYRECADGNIHLSIPLPSLSAILEDTRDRHFYCFSNGRHSGSFYLKIGAAGFCLGHLIHSGLLLGYQIVFLTSEGSAFYECASVATLVLDITYPLYSFLLLYFIFKYSNVIINRRSELSRFAVMHCIASSLCFWIWTILRETTDSLSHHSNLQIDEDNFPPSTERISEINYQNTDGPTALALTAYSQKGAMELVNFFNETARPKITSACLNDARLNVIYQNFSPYLYPFTVEYSILVVGVLFIIWQKIDDCKKFEDDGSKKHCPTPGINKENGFASNLVIHVDCHSANTGLFAGILVIVSSIVSIILFFIAISNAKYISHGVIVNTITELVFEVLMTISAVIAYKKITQLDVNYNQVSLLDDLLLFLCIPAFFLNAIFSVIPAVQDRNWMSIANILLQVIQVVIQTPLIMDGLRRCSNSRELRLEKPGRGLITFLVVCNVAIWITETFEIKSHELLDERFVFYGKIWWTIIGHMTVPLTMFYRFHSSVCLVDIWKSAYEPALKFKS